MDSRQLKAAIADAKEQYDDQLIDEAEYQWQVALAKKRYNETILSQKRGLTYGKKNKW